MFRKRKANSGMKVYLSTLVVYFFFHQVVFSQVDSNGFNVFYYSNGNKSSEGFMRDGKPDGYWKTYFENGNLKTEGNRKDFQLDSLWKFYSESGSLLNEINYQNGKKNGLSRSYSSEGYLEKEEYYVDNIRSGEFKEFHPNGNVKRKGNFESDKITGKVIELDSLGKIVVIQEFQSGNLYRSQNINRLSDDGKKIGKWVEFYDDGTIKSEQEFNNGLQIGYLKEYDKKGNLKVLEKYEEGEKQENVEEIVFIDIRTTYHPNGNPKLIGGYSNDLKNGVFREYDSTGNLIGSKIYQFDTLVGEGIVEETGTYSGEWKFYFPNGELKAKGIYEDGLRSGEWIFYHPNGKIEQKGKFVKGKPHGSWKWYHPNGQLHREEVFRYGKEEGEISEYDSSGVLLTKGEYISGLRNGLWFYAVGDHTEKGNYIDGERDGYWEYRYQDSTIAFKGNYKNGLAEGKHVYYHPNGVIRLEGKYRQGLKDGEWRYYDNFGYIKKTRDYKRGVLRKMDGVRVKEKMDPEPINSVD